MSRSPTLFRQRDLVRALKAARAAGVQVRIELEPRKMTVIPCESYPTTAPVQEEVNEWDTAP
jgi:hypothetical protein